MFLRGITKERLNPKPVQADAMHPMQPFLCLENGGPTFSDETKECRERIQDGKNNYREDSSEGCWQG
jgi:hypothetical protein